MKAFTYSIDVLSACNLRCPSCPVENMRDVPTPKNVMSPEAFEATRPQDQGRDAGPRQDRPVQLGRAAPPSRSPSSYRDRAPPWPARRPLRQPQRLGAASKRSCARGRRAFRSPCRDFFRETYGRTHAGGEIETVKANLRRLRETLDRLGGRTRVRVTYYCYIDNLGEDYRRVAPVPPIRPCQILSSSSAAIGASLEEGQPHVAEQMAAVPAIRDIPPRPSAGLEGRGIASGLENVGVGPAEFEAGVVEPPVGPDDRHQEGMAAEGTEVPDGAEIAGDPHDPHAATLGGVNLVHETAVAFVAPQARVDGHVDDLGRELEAAALGFRQGQHLLDLLEVVRHGHDAQDDPGTRRLASGQGELQGFPDGLGVVPAADEPGQLVRVQGVDAEDQDVAEAQDLRPAGEAGPFGVERHMEAQRAGPFEDVLEVRAHQGLAARDVERAGLPAEDLEEPAGVGRGELTDARFPERIPRRRCSKDSSRRSGE